MKQIPLFNSSDIDINSCENEWIDMPEYQNVKQEDAEFTATFKFRNKNDYDYFHSIVKKHIYNDEKVFDGMQSVNHKQAWYPLIEKSSKYVYTDIKKAKKPLFPIYIVSKGRWHRNPTCKTLQRMGVDFYIIVEEDEYNNYLELVDADQLLVLPKKYMEEYDRFWKDDDPRCGPGAARNFAWDHSIKNGYAWHWVMDDNIESFKRLNNNKKIICNSPTIFHIVEKFVVRYDNLAISGLCYDYFCPATDARPPIKFNTRIYSCLLIRNDIPYRWRGRYNEDTDLSLRALKDGWVTVQFNAFLQEKRATQTVSGGNSKEFYDEEGTLKKSQMLEDMHPDVAKVAWRFNRWHHTVDYNPFKGNAIKRKPNILISDNVNNYGLTIEKNV